MDTKELARRTNVWGGLTGSLLILIVGILLGLGALCIVYLIPTDRMFDNAQVSCDIISEIDTTYSIHEMKSTQRDNYTDSIMVSTTICPKEASVLEKAIYNYHVSYFRGYLEQENLERYLRGEEGYDYNTYSHYWNGYLVFLKPLLFLFEYNDVLMLNYIVQMLLLIWVIIGMAKKGKDFLILPDIIMMVSIGAPITTGVSIQLSDVLYLSMIGSGIIIWNSSRMKDRHIYYLFLVLGMMTSYFDFLTYPLFSLGIPLIIYIACSERKETMQYLSGTIINSIGWSVGYVGMWIGKGLLGSLLFPDSGALQTGMEHFMFRTSNATDAEKVDTFDVLMRNAFTYINWPVLTILVLMAIYYFIKIYKHRYWDKSMLQKVLSYAVVFLYPLVWYAIMKNHSYLHAFMTYRILGISLFAGFVILSEWGKKEAV